MSIEHYGRREYWDKRYTHDGQNFDWYGRLEDFKNEILEHLKPSELSILNIGAGNSRRPFIQDSLKSSINGE